MAGFLHYIFSVTFLPIQGRLCVANLKSSFRSPVAANWKNRISGRQKCPPHFLAFYREFVSFSTSILHKRCRKGCRFSPFIVSECKNRHTHRQHILQGRVIEKTRHLKLNDLLEEEKENGISKEPSLAHTLRMYREEKGWRQVGQGFSSFFAKFCHMWLFLKVERAEGAMKHWKINKCAKNLAQDEEKPWPTYLQPIFRLMPGTRSTTN